MTTNSRECQIITVHIVGMTVAQQASIFLTSCLSKLAKVETFTLKVGLSAAFESALVVSDDVGEFFNWGLGGDGERIENVVVEGITHIHRGPLGVIDEWINRFVELIEHI